MHDRAIHDAPPADGIARDPLGSTGGDRLARAGQSSACGQQMKELTFETNQGSCPPTEETQGAVGDRVEYRLDVGRRLADNAQDLTRRRLLFQRLLRLVEQPNVLNGDNRLVGEGLEERDLVVGKWSRLATANAQCPDDMTLVQQRYDQQTSKTPGPRLFS